MKIGFVRRGYSPTGGAEAYLLRLAHGVAAEGHVPVLVASGDWPVSKWPNEFVIHVPGERSPMQFAREAERAAAGCDVVFSMERVFSCDVYRAGDGVHRAWLERRAVFEPAWKRWLRWTNRKHRELLRLERCVYSPKHTRLVIANSRMVRDEIVEHYGYPAERIEVIPNGYDAPAPESGLRERRRAELALTENGFVALFAGSGWDRKGLRTAVEAARELPEMTLLVAGRGKSFAMPPNVRLLGPRAGLQADFAATDVFVLPTFYDPFSNACLEALAAGLPVLTTTANGFSEIVTDGAHGSIFTPGDTAGLVNALRFWEPRAAATRAECRALAARYSVAENTRRTLEAITRTRPR
jgi:UDP-glucose:(heptosyl)LPS alpha-1,3-glucosyltransferase